MNAVVQLGQRCTAAKGPSYTCDGRSELIEQIRCALVSFVG